MNSSLYGVETSPEPQRAPRSGPRCILIVEDDPLQSEILEYWLQQQNYTTVILPHGRQLLETARQLQPDLILLDVELPDANGLELCEQLADDQATQAIPVVIVSGTEQPDVVRCARISGSRFFLSKPYDPNTLLIVAQHAIRDADQWI